MKRLMLCALLLAAPAAAGFTAQEKAQVGKVILARHEFQAAFVALADSVRDFGDESNRQQHADILAAGIDAVVACHDAQKWLQGSTPASFHAGTFVEAPRLPDLPREQIVAQAFVFISECSLKGDVFAQGMVAFGTLLGNTRIVNQGNRILSVVKLETFDSTLSYTNPYPPAAPRVVGPHGDFEEAEHNLEAGDLKATESIADIVAFYRFVDVFPEGAVDGVREAIRYGAPIGGIFARAWGLDVGIEGIAQDAVEISADLAAGSGLRDRPFFRLLREVELLGASPKMPPLFSGRTPFGGAAGNFQVAMGPMGKALLEAARVNTREEVITWFDAGAGVDARAQLVRSTGFLQEWLEDHSLGWKHLDQSLASWILFFHEILPRP
jgi:hypothetical protein